MRSGLVLGQVWVFGHSGTCDHLSSSIGLVLNLSGTSSLKLLVGNMAPVWALGLSSGTDLESWTVVAAQSWTLLESAQFGYPKQGYWSCFGGLMDAVIQNWSFCMSSVCLLTLYSRYWSLPPAFLSVNNSGFMEGKTNDRKLHSAILMTSEFSRFCSDLFCFGFCLLLLYVSIFGCFYVFVEFWILILWILYSLILWILYYVAPEFSFNIF